jgi:hypothetical protein
MKEINLLDETFDNTQAHNYNLFIQTGSDGVSYCLLDVIRNKYVAFRHFPSKNDDFGIDEVISSIQSDPVLKLNFKRVSHMLTDGKYTLVPESYFEENKEDSIFQFNQTQEKLSEVFFNNLKEAQAVNIFAYPQYYQGKLKTIFPNLKPYHRSSSFIESLVLNSAKWTHSKCFVLINKHEIDIGIAQKKNLEFSNSFSYKEKTDIVYYILNSLEQFKFSPKFTEVFVSIDLENSDEILDLLKNYLGLIRFIHPFDQYTYSYMFEEKHLIHFANLFNLVLCAL